MVGERFPPWKICALFNQSIRSGIVILFAGLTFCSDQDIDGVESARFPPRLPLCGGVLLQGLLLVFGGVGIILALSLTAPSKLVSPAGSSPSSTEALASTLLGEAITLATFEDLFTCLKEVASRPVVRAWLRWRRSQACLDSTTDGNIPF